MKKTNFILPFLLLMLFSCSQPQEHSVTTPPQVTKEPQQLVDTRLAALFDSIPVRGSVLIWDAQNNQYHSNDFTRARQGYLPASTFKIPNTLIGLETGFVADENHLFKWNGESRYLKIWEQDLTIRQAFQRSCVPCYQELARGVGFEKMQSWVKKLGFGRMVVSPESLDQFWLTGPSRINQFEQIDFLRRFYEQELPISDRTYSLMEGIMLVNQTAQYRLSAKSGMSVSSDGKDYKGWYVGFVEKGSQPYFFATNIEPTESDPVVSDFSRLRTSISLKALSLIVGENIELD